jgi:hypothetical protein
VTDPATRQAQRIRLNRFYMASATYVVVMLGSLLLVNIGLGALSVLQWALYLGLAALISAVLYTVFRLDLNLRFKDPSLTREQIVISALWGMIPLYGLPAARPIILMFYLPPFSFGMLRFTRRQYLGTVGILMAIYAALLAVERAMGRPGFRLDYELFLFVAFGILLTWFAFFGGFVSSLRRELSLKRRAIEKSHAELQLEMVERVRTQAENEKLIGELETSLAKVRRLRGLLPICASCKKIRDDTGYWNQIESYISMHSEADFSHGICPECSERLYPHLAGGEPAP